MASSEQGGKHERIRDDIEFLVSSWNRHDILNEIVDGPKTRHQLKDETEVSRTTLSRILADLEDREWVRRVNNQYESTNRGEFVATELSRLVGNLKTLDQLGEAVDWLHINEFDFDLHHLQDATVVTPTWSDFTAQTSTIMEQVVESAHIRAIGTGLDREFFHLLGEQAATGVLDLELILAPDVADLIPDEPELARVFQDIADSPEATVYRYGGESALMMLGLFTMEDESDNHVMVCGNHDDGASPGLVKSEQDPVWTWAESYFESRLVDSNPLEPTVFTP